MIGKKREMVSERENRNRKRGKEHYVECNFRDLYAYTNEGMNKQININEK